MTGQSTILFHITGFYLFSASGSLEKKLSFNDSTQALIAESYHTVRTPEQFDTFVQSLPEYTSLHGTNAVLHNPFAAPYPENLYKALEQPSVEKKVIESITRRRIAQSITPDFFVIQAISLYQEYDSALERISSRLRDFLKLYDPEQVTADSDAETLFTIIESLDPEQKATETDRMGATFTQQEQLFLLSQKQHLIDAKEARDSCLDYIEQILKKIAPNLLAVTDPRIAALLLRQSGGLYRLMLMPASTIQVLGAEKALFRHLRSKAKSPKYGVLYMHSIVQQAPFKKRGKVARFIADQISIATKVDYYKGEYVGDMLCDKIKKKLDSIR